MIDILCFSSTDWHGIWGSRQQIMRRLAARGHRVLFVERPIGLEHWLRYAEFRRRKGQRWREGMVEIEPGLQILSLPLLLPGRYYSPAINRINQQITIRFVRRYQAQLKMSAPLLWLYNPFQGDLIGHFDELFTVYHCIDEWTAGTSGRKYNVIRQLELNLLQRADLVFANSLPIFEEKRQFNANTHRIPSGVDIERFVTQMEREGSIPAALTQIPTPRIGYSGHINDRLDYTVLEALAAQRPEWSLVLIGDTHPWSMSAPPLQRLQAYPNVYFLGKQPYADMPALLQGLDVCLMPYIDDARGRYRSPLKLYEYLAVGKPIVSTPHAEASEFADVVYQAATAAAFVETVAHALVEDDPSVVEQRIAIARQHSWDARVEEMMRIIRDSPKMISNERAAPIDIVYFITELNIGGAEKVLVHFLRELDRRRYRPLVACLYGADGPIGDELRALGIRVVDLGMTAQWRLDAFLRLVQLLRQVRPTILHSSLFHANVMGRLAGRLTGVPIIISCRQNISIGAQWREWVNRWTVGLDDRVIAVCELARKMELEQTGIPPGKVVTIYNAVDPSAVAATNAGQIDEAGNASIDSDVPGLMLAPKSDPTTVLIGTVCRFHPQKGLHYLIAAFAALLECIPQAHLVLVGDGELRQALEEQAQALGVAAQITFTGFRTDVPAILAQLDLFVLPSLWEGLPLVLLEAMAARLPVVATAVGGTPELVVDGETGILVPPADVEALTTAMQQLLSAQDLRQRMGQKGRLRVEQEFSAAKAVRETTALYEQLVQQKLSGKIARSNKTDATKAIE